MPPVNPELVEAFSAKAAIVNAVVQEVPSMAAALQYVVDVCENKAPAELLADEPGVQQGPLGPNKVPTRVQRIVAAPDLDDEDFAVLALACEEKGFACLRNGLRNHLAGMISEIHVILLRKSDIYPDLPSIAQLLRERMNAAPATYTTLITGPSRTADIERVGAVGVHGPLELHIILLED